MRVIKQLIKEYIESKQNETSFSQEHNISLHYYQISKANLFFVCPCLLMNKPHSQIIKQTRLTAPHKIIDRTALQDVQRKDCLDSGQREQIQLYSLDDQKILLSHLMGQTLCLVQFRLTKGSIVPNMAFEQLFP